MFMKSSAIYRKKKKYQTTDFVDPYNSMGVTIEKRKIRSFFLSMITLGLIITILDVNCMCLITAL